MPLGLSRSSTGDSLVKLAPHEGAALARGTAEVSGHTLRRRQFFFYAGLALMAGVGMALRARRYQVRDWYQQAALAMAGAPAPATGAGSDRQTGLSPSRAVGELPAVRSCSWR